MNAESTVSNRVIIPNNVADAIERKRNRTDGQPVWSNEDFVEATLRGIGDTQKALRTIPFEALLAALVNGYEREKTPEEITHERIRIVFEKRIQSGTSASDSQEITRSLSFADGIKYALNELGVNIEGVNA